MPFRRENREFTLWIIGLLVYDVLSVLGYVAVVQP